MIREAAKQSRRRQLLVCAIATAGYCSIAHGTTFTWTRAGTNNNWNNAANWSSTLSTAPPLVPTDPDVTDLLYTGNLGANNTSTQLGGDYLINSITIDSTYTSSTAGSLSLSTGTVPTNENLTIGAGGVTDLAAGTITINPGSATSPKLTIGADQTWKVDGATAWLQVKRETIGTSTLTKKGTGTLEIAVAAPNFTGTIDLQEGLLRLDVAGTLANATIANISDSIATISCSNSVDQSFGGPVYLGGAGTLLFAGTGSAAFTNSVVLSSLKRISQSSARVLRFSGPISGTGGIQKLGSGFLTLTGSNSYSGDTIVGNGTVTINDFSQFGSATTPIGIGGTTVGGALVINSPDQSTTRGLTINPFGGSLTFAGNLTVGAVTGANIASGTLTKVSSGILTTGSIQIGTLSATAGAVVTAPNGTDAGTNRLGTLILGGGVGAWSSKLDLNNNNLIIDYTGASPLATVADQIKTGYSSGTWTGQGITSGSAATVAATPNAHPTALGFAEASTLGLSSFSGQSVDGDAIVVKYTYAGDANLDGIVNALDFNALASSFGSSASWAGGDFNFDGTVGTPDFTAMSQNFNLSISPAPSLGSLVPEPVMTTSMLFSLLMLGRRRR